MEILSLSCCLGSYSCFSLQKTVFRVWNMPVFDVFACRWSLLLRHALVYFEGKNAVSVWWRFVKSGFLSPSSSFSGVETALFCSKSVRTRACMRVCGLYVGDLYPVSAVRWYGKRDWKHKRKKRASTSDKMLFGFCQSPPYLCQVRCLSFGSDAESIRKES